MDETFARISVNLSNNNLQLKLNINGNPIWHENRIFYPNINTDGLILYWFLNILKQVLFSMPINKIDFEASQDTYQKLSNIILQCAKILDCTNDTISKYFQLNRKALNNTNILFFNVGDDYRYKNLYESFPKFDGSSLLYMNMDLGYNSFTRTWHSTDIPVPLPDLVDLIFEESIRKISSINHYFLEIYLNKTYVYLPALFRYLGVEYIIIDNDNWDIYQDGYLQKSFWTCPSFNRFSTERYFHEYWDNKYGLQNIHYIISPQTYKDSGDFFDIDENYSLLILSNSRINDIRSDIIPVIYLLDHMNPNNIYKDIQTWYCALRHMILEVFDLDDFESLYFNSKLLRIFYIIMQFLKYETIESINTTRNIQIYGDKGWQTLFPHYYQNKHLDYNEMQGLFSSKRYLYLLFNLGISYFDISFQVYDALNNNVPFINYSPVVKTSLFEGFRQIEYNNSSELNHLIENIRNKIRNKDLKDSIHFLKNILISNTDSLISHVVFNTEFSHKTELYLQQYNDHKCLLDNVIQEYIDQNEPILRETFNVLLLGHPVQYDISNSKYINRRYIQRHPDLSRQVQDALK